MLPSEMQECETLFEFKSKVKSWKPINCPRKICKTYIGGVQWMEQYTPCDKPYESIQNVGFFDIKENLQSRFQLMLNIPILSGSFCSAFHVVVCKLLIVFIKFLCYIRQKNLYFLCNFCTFKFFNFLFFWYILKLFSNSLRSNENNLIYFLKQLGNKGKRKFSASRAVFSCNVLRGNKVAIFLS